MDFRTLCFWRPEGLAFTAVAIFQIGTNMYKAVGGFAKFDRRYLPMTPRDSNNKKETMERNQVNSVFPLKGQLLVDLMILYLGSRHLFEVILFAFVGGQNTSQFHQFQSRSACLGSLGFQDIADSIKKKERLSDASSNELLAKDRVYIYDCCSFLWLGSTKSSKSFAFNLWCVTSVKQSSVDNGSSIKLDLGAHGTLPRHLIHEKYPGLLDCIGDYTTQLYRDYNKRL